ncbi:site-specific integrase [Streptomyces olivochromogenes]|nr:site-specific integrase [Streptomyces olivochromogenes]
MAKIAYISGVRASELCAVRLGDIHWELGQWGRFVVQGKGAGGSGKRERQAYLFEEGRELLWWNIEEVRGSFSDDPSDPAAPLFPSERRPRAVTALDIVAAAAVQPDAFRKALKTAGMLYLPGPAQGAPGTGPERQGQTRPRPDRAVYGIRPKQVAEIRLDDLDRSTGRLRIRRPNRPDHDVCWTSSLRSSSRTGWSNVTASGR